MAGLRQLGKDYQGTRFSQLGKIDRGNVKKLAPKWNMTFGVNDAQESQTTVVNGRTGETLWRFQVGTGIHGNPTTFTVDGKQYVAIVYGPGGGSLWPLVYDELFRHQNRGCGMMVFGLAD